MIQRLKNPIFIAAVAGFAYQVLAKYDVAPDLGMWQLGVDIVSYVLIGAGVYSTFKSTNK